LFCQITKRNDARKSLVQFYKSLFLTGILAEDKYLHIVGLLANQLAAFLVEPGRKNHAEETAEMLSILFIRKITTNYHGLVMNMSLNACIQHLSKSKPVDYPSLSSKTIFKCLDMLTVDSSRL